VNSQVFDHTSTIQFIEKRFGVHERNISPWRRAVCGDLTSAFNFKNPNGDRGEDQVKLPSTAGFLPSVAELSGTGGPATVIPTTADVIIGVPAQEKGVRPARAIPYELNVQSAVDAASSTLQLTFVNSGKQGAVFQVRSDSTTDPVRNCTVEAGKTLSGTWIVSGLYGLTVYRPNGFTRYFKGSIGAGAAALQVHSEYGTDDEGSIFLSVRNAGSQKATVTVLDAYSGEKTVRHARPGRAYRGRAVMRPVRRLVRLRRHGRGGFELRAATGRARRDRTRQHVGSGDGRPGYPEGLRTVASRKFLACLERPCLRVWPFFLCTQHGRDPRDESPSRQAGQKI